MRAWNALARISFFVLLVFILGCTSQALKDYDMAKQMHSTASYEHFIKKYPDSKYTEEAKERKEILFWEEAKKKNTIQSFDSYLNEYPRGSFSREANQYKERLLWEEVKNDNTILSYKDYLDKYPRGRFADKATQYIGKLEGEKKKEKIGSTFLTIITENIGSTYKEKDKYFIHRERHWLGFVDEYIYKYDTGHSGYYPMQQMCFINGVQRRINKDGEFYKGHIMPGAYEIVTSFTEGKWDAYNHRQLSGAKHTKRFYINISKNDNIELMIFYIYNGLDSGIEVKAARKKERIERGVIGTVYETIEVIQ